MRIEEVSNEDALGLGRPLDGVRILALEQMQALPFATQLLARLGADVVKVEPPTGDSGRGSEPSMKDPQGRSIGATFLRNNLNKRSIVVDLKSARGRDLILDLAPRFDIVAENSKAGSMVKLGLGYDDVRAVHPLVIYASVSGFGNGGSPYSGRPAFAAIVEAMTGIYEMKREGGRPPVPAPMGGLGDIAAALFTSIGVLSALRQRDRTGVGSYIDIAMFDAMVSMTDLVTNYWSLGLRGDIAPIILNGFRASDGWFVLQVGREGQFAKLAELLGEPDWVSDPRLATRQGWVDHLEEIIRPAVESWASDFTRDEACDRLGAAGLAAGPCLRDEEVVVDPHLAGRRMLVEMERTDGVEQPVIIPGSPIKMSSVVDGPDTRVPWLGEHTDEILAKELGLSAEALAHLHTDGVIF